MKTKRRQQSRDREGADGILAKTRIRFSDFKFNGLWSKVFALESLVSKVLREVLFTRYEIYLCHSKRLVCYSKRPFCHSERQRRIWPTNTVFFIRHLKKRFEHLIFEFRICFGFRYSFFGFIRNTRYASRFTRYEQWNIK